MSTAGTGVVAVGAGVAVVGIVPLIAIAAVGSVAVGTGVLIAKGVMWCGDKMEANYQSACQQWATQMEKARAENLANVEQMSTQITSQLEHLSASEYETTRIAPQRNIDHQALIARIARTHVVINDELVTQSQIDTEREFLATRLRAEIENGRGFLPMSLLTEADQALQGSTAMIKQALNTLEEAWNNISEQSAQRTRTMQQTQLLLITVSNQLSAIDTMLIEIGSSDRALYTHQQRQLAEKVRDAEARIESHPARALEQIRSAQQEAKLLLESVSAASLDIRKQVRRQINTQIGILRALETMIQEARTITLVKGQALDSLAERVAKTLNAAMQLQQQPDVQKQLMRLTERVTLLKEDVFREVKQGQQKNVADIIQSTLAELGFLAEDNTPPTITTNGETMRVEVMPFGLTETGGRNDRLITFDISRDGQVNYDFAGYSGNSCLGDAQKVFSALREKGLFILDDAALKKMQSIKEVSSETLKLETWQPTLVQNKTQAELAEALKNVLDQMGYAQLRQNVVGGFIELEAFNGPLGYSVVLSPEGEMQIFKDSNHIDVSNDSTDMIVEQAQKIREEQSAPRIKKSKAPYMKSRKSQILGHE